MSKRSDVDILSTSYKTFRGVDFSSDPSIVDKTRSPWGTNMISDEGGNPEKRPGYENIANMPYYDEGIKGIFVYRFDNKKAMNLTWERGGVEVDATFDIDLKQMYAKVGAYGETTVEAYYWSLLTTGGWTVEVECGEYEFSETYDTPDEAEECLADFGITNISIGSVHNTITFTSSARVLTGKHILVLSNNAVYRDPGNGSFSSIFSYNATDKKASSVYLNGYLFIFTGRNMIYYDGETIDYVSNKGYVPLTVISCAPGSTPGGVAYEDVNLMSSKQKVSFTGDGTNADYHLPYTDLDSTVVTVTVDGTTKTAGTHYNFNSTTGVVTFTSGNIPAAPSAGAADNVVIEFTKYFTDMGVINKCNVTIAWGVNGAADRIVCSGNTDYPNRDYTSDYNNGFYFPDTNYQIVGSGTTRIMGYRRIGENLAIIKEDNGQDATVYLRSGSLGTSGAAVWSTYACLSGVGGVSNFGFGNIGDDQLVLTGNGVYAITSNYTTAEKIAELRSKYVNPQLVKEELADAHCVNFRNMMLIFFPNGHVYVLDGRQAKSYSSRNETTYNYECYYWDNCPAIYAMVDTEDGVDSLYFGDDEGNLYQFMWDTDEMKKYSDGGYWDDLQKTAKFDGDGETATFQLPYTAIDYVEGLWVNDVVKTEGTHFTVNKALGTITFTAGNIPPAGEENITVWYHADRWVNGTAITAVWATKADDDGDPMVLKTMLKKGNAVTLKPFSRSSAKVLLRTDKDVIAWQCNTGVMDIFDWEDIDFSRFTFNANDAPREIPFNRKVKNYKRLQIIAKNDAVNEGFGVFVIVKHYVTGNFAKK